LRLVVAAIVAAATAVVVVATAVVIVATAVVIVGNGHRAGRARRRLGWLSQRDGRQRQGRQHRQEGGDEPARGKGSECHLLVLSVWVFLDAATIGSSLSGMQRNR
jgi:hypothetical protein